MWRKTRKPQRNSCFGADANRNFPFYHAGKLQWLEKNNNTLYLMSRINILIHLPSFSSLNSETGASTNPCSETYSGPKAFSEPETQALADFIKSFDNIRLYLSFHSYGQMLLFPYVNRYLLFAFAFHSAFFICLSFQGHSKNRALNFNSLVIPKETCANRL